MAKINEERQREQEQKVNNFMEEQSKQIEQLFKPAGLTMKPPKEAIVFQKMMTDSSPYKQA